MSQRRIQKEIRASEEIKWIHNVPEPGVGAGLRKMFITMNTHIIDYFIPQKMRNKDLPVVSRRKAVIKVRAEINRREGKTQQEQNQGFIYLYIYIFFYFYIPVTVFSPPPSFLFMKAQASHEYQQNTAYRVAVSSAPCIKAGQGDPV